MSSSADALAERKASTRASVKSALRRLSDDDMASQSAAISRHVLASLSAFAPDETRAPDAPPLRLGLYVHCAKLREVDTAPLLAAALAHPRAELYLPIVDVDPEKARTPSMRFLRVRSLDDDLEPKTMGIMEPKETLADGAPRENLDDAEDPSTSFSCPVSRSNPTGDASDAEVDFTTRSWNDTRRSARREDGPNRRLSRWRTTRRCSSQESSPQARARQRCRRDRHRERDRGHVRTRAAPPCDANRPRRERDAAA